MELKKYKIGNVLELQRGYDLPSSQMIDGNVLVAGSNGIIGTHNVARGNSPCITVGRSGSVGKVHFYEQPVWVHNTSLFVKNFKGNDPKYLFYFLRNLHLDEIFGKSSSVVPSLDRKVVHAMTTPFQDDIDKQKDISYSLSLLDQKIALNRAINRNLEALAKQLYDYWFVQFDFPNEEGKPYKSSGGKMIWSEGLKREIPDGWECHKIKDLATTYSGGTPLSSKKEYYENGDIPWINSGELNNSFITSTFNYISKCGLDNSSAKLYPSDTILVALYGATAGKVSLLTFEACSNQAVCGVIMNDPTMTNYTRFYLSSLFDYFVLLSTGSARDNISQDTIKNTWIVKPADRVLVSFNLLIKQTTKAVIVNQIENEKLTKQRDELLPLLMNGQVSVNSDLSAC